MNVPPPAPPAAAPATPPAGGGARVIFAAGNADLPDDARTELDTLAQRLNAHDHARLQLVAYASGRAEDANQARRLSLQRALAVRTYLMGRGVPNTRMDVRALGNRLDGNDSPDRVDVVMVDR
jgi:outer membrane protein OmpA-like peptidoglycan-associated protein